MWFWTDDMEALQSPAVKPTGQNLCFIHATQKLFLSQLRAGREAEGSAVPALGREEQVSEDDRCFNPPLMERS